MTHSSSTPLSYLDACTGAFSYIRCYTFGGFRAARYRGVDDLVATVTPQFVEADVVAGVTLTSMAQLIATMDATGQFAATDLIAWVLSFLQERQVECV